MKPTQVEIQHYGFENTLFERFNTNRFVKELWPLVYILSDGDTRTAYVGETTDAFSRMSAHLKHHRKSKLTSVRLITSEKFNKSATLDIESNLIKYMSGDNIYKLLNANLGLANHNYYQKKQVYWDIFNDIWNQLRSEGIAKHSLEHIDNSDLFKYSPYKSLSPEQRIGLREILESIVSGSYKNTVVEGGAGTGKTILAIFLFKMLSSDLGDFTFKEFGAEEKYFIELIDEIKNKLPQPKMALVVPMSSFRSTLKKAFKNIKGLNASMVIGPAEVSKNRYDLLVVDESHRLRRRVNLGAYFGAFDKVCEALNLDKHHCSELDWVVQQSAKTILFYDDGQSIKPSDTKKEEFDKLKLSESTNVLKLKSQFRVRGGNAYVEYVDALLNGKEDHLKKMFNSPNYEFTLFQSIEDMVEQIKKRNNESGLSRLIAGYSWEWKSNKDPSVFDISIGDVKLKWNGTSNDWINSENSIDEVGCIHTTQGYDLNYSGIIFGNEISYDPVNQEIVVNEENYFDKNGKQSIKSPNELKVFILNIYKTIMLRGIKGTYVYVCDSNLRSYFESFIPKFESARQHSEIPVLKENILPFVNAIPLYDLRVSAGNFSDTQKVNDNDWIKLPEGVVPNENLFACRVIGESMNKIIPNGSICLFRKYTGGSRNGQILLVESSSIHDEDFGSCYTIKEYESKKVHHENGWKHETVILKPRSHMVSYSEIELKDDELATFKVLGVFERVIK